MGVDQSSFFAIIAERNCGALYALRLEAAPEKQGRCTSITPFPIKSAALGMAVTVGSCALAEEDPMGPAEDANVIVGSFSLCTMSSETIDNSTYSFEVGVTNWDEVSTTSITPDTSASQSKDTPLPEQDSVVDGGREAAALMNLLANADKRDLETVTETHITDGMMSVDAGASQTAQKGTHADEHREFPSNNGTPREIPATATGPSESVNPVPVESEPVTTSGDSKKSATANVDPAPFKNPQNDTVEQPARSPEPLSQADQIMGVATGRPGGRKQYKGDRNNVASGFGRESTVPTPSGESGTQDAILQIVQQQQRDMQVLCEMVRTQQQQISMMKTDIARSEFAISTHLSAVIRKELSVYIETLREGQARAEKTEGEKVKRLMSAVQDSMFSSLDSIVRDSVAAVVEEKLLPEVSARGGESGSGATSVDIMQQISPALSQVCCHVQLHELVYV